MANIFDTFKIYHNPKHQFTFYIYILVFLHIMIFMFNCRSVESIMTNYFKGNTHRHSRNYHRWCWL